MPKTTYVFVVVVISIAVQFTLLLCHPSASSKLSLLLDAGLHMYNRTYHHVCAHQRYEKEKKIYSYSQHSNWYFTCEINASSICDGSICVSFGIIGNIIISWSHMIAFVWGLVSTNEILIMVRVSNFGLTSCGKMCLVEIPYLFELYAYRLLLNFYLSIELGGSLIKPLFRIWIKRKR